MGRRVGGGRGKHSGSVEKGFLIPWLTLDKNANPWKLHLDKWTDSLHQSVVSADQTNEQIDSFNQWSQTLSWLDSE